MIQEQKKKRGFLSSNSNVWYIWYNPLFEVCGIVCSWNISASSYKRYMCPQLPCCLLNTDLGPNAPAQHWSSACCDSYFPTLFCPFYSIPWVALRFCSLALFFLNSSAFINSRIHSCYRPLLCPHFFFSEGLLAILQTRNLILKKPCPFVSARDRGWEEKRKKDTEEYKGQITKADRGWARPKAHGTPAVI